MNPREEYALETAIEITKEIAKGILYINPTMTPNRYYAASIADFIEELYERLSKIELTNQAKP